MGAYSFTRASSQYLTGATPVTAEPFLIAAWVRPENAAANEEACCIGVNGSGNNFRSLNRNASQKPQGISRDTGSQTAQVATAMTALTWNMIAAAFISSTSRAAYLNGANKATNSVSASPSAPDTLLVGAEHGASLTNFWGGHIADLFIYDLTGMSGTDIDTLVSNLYNSGSGTIDVPSQSSLIDLVRFTSSGAINGDKGVVSLTNNGATFDGANSPPVTYNALTSTATPWDKVATANVTPEFPITELGSRFYSGAGSSPIDWITLPNGTIVPRVINPYYYY